MHASIVCPDWDSRRASGDRCWTGISPLSKHYREAEDCPAFRQKWRGRWLLSCRETVLPFPLTWPGRMGLPFHSLYSHYSQVLALRTILHLIRITVLKLHHYHTIALLRELKPARLTLFPFTLHSRGVPWGQVPQDACMLHTFTSTSICPPLLEDSLPSHF